MPSQHDYSAIPNEGEASSSNSTFFQPLRNRSLRDYVSARKIPAAAITAIVVFTALLVGLVTYLPDNSNNRSKYDAIQPPIGIGISTSVLEDGLSKCQQIKQDIIQSTNNNRTYNPRAPKNIQPVLLRNAVVWDGEGQILNNVDILMIDGVISEIKSEIQAPESAKIIDVGGNIVSPGLVDMHTHLGVMSWPDLSGTSDTNEKTDPITPFVRTIDAFNPSDKAIRIVASGGITTALVLPGSGNLIGGEAFVFKLRPTGTLSNQDMLVQAGIDETTEQKWRYMKMACGENPKSYGNRGTMPSTRLGEAYLFRKSFTEAQELKQAQEDWCEAAERLSSQSNFNKEKVQLNKPFPEDLRLESLTALLRGQVKLNIHCYETHDIEALVRHAEEFNFNISAFHHALEAYKIPDILRRARNNITIATFADHWGYKKEAYEASPQAPKLLFEAGIPVALKSDHPVLNSQHMAFEAAKTTHYGLPPQEAFKSITSTPAKALGLNHRIGSLKVGYDADVVIWDRNPLAIGAAPYQVFIDGIPQFDMKPINPAKPIVEKSQTLVEKTKLETVGSKNFVLTNIGTNYLLEESTSMVVKDGKILCHGNEMCGSKVFDDSLDVIDVQGGFVLPGMVAVGSKLGMVEIPSEGSTGDGIVPAAYSQNPNSIVEAVDGLKLGTKKLDEAYKGGVLTTISSPISKNIVIGVSAAFKTNADSVLTDGALLSPFAALHFQIGHSVKSERFPTISSQIAFLRQTFKENLASSNRYGQAARGEIPIIVMVNNKDEIASLINLKTTVIPKARMAIMGGAEAHLLAPHLARANIAVILRPYLCTPENFDSSHCLTGAPLTNGTAAHVLHYYGVKLGIGISDDGWARNLAWDAGWLAATSPSKELAISDAEAIKFVTTNLQEIFGLKAEEEEFVVWSGNPMDMQHTPLFIFDSVNGLRAV